MDARVQHETKTASPSRLRLGWPARGGALARVDSRAPSRRPGAGQGVLAPEQQRIFGVRAIPIGPLITFILLVVIPTACASVYFGLIASPIYVSEAKFAVRGSTQKLPSSNADAGALPVGNIPGGLASLNNSQDSYVVADYIKSAPLIEKLNRDDYLRSVFGRNDIDLLSRLRSSSSLDALREYWDSMVGVSVENLSGILTLRVHAFNPQDALAISRAILNASEALVNSLSERRLADAIRTEQDELDRSRRRLEAARLAAQEFRNRSGQLDPMSQSRVSLQLATLLQTEKLKLESELQTSRRTLTDKSPSVQVLSARLQAINDQIQRADREITSTNPDDPTLSRALYQFEGLEVERQFAQRLYMVSQAGVERARMNAARQQLYLTTFVEPSLAEMALYPHRLTNILIVFLASLAPWTVLTMLTAAIKDHVL
jgi:capsular polysaccharide transport system permease protein